MNHIAGMNERIGRPGWLGRAALMLADFFSGVDGRHGTAGGRETAASHSDPMLLRKILVPIDLTKCSLEVFLSASTIATECDASIILLHVVNLNIAVPERRILDELTAQAEQSLKQLAALFLSPNLAISLRVRMGNPAEEIVREARETKANLIILAGRREARRWNPFGAHIAGKVVRNAPCTTSHLRVRTHFNCEEDWMSADWISPATVVQENGRTGSEWSMRPNCGSMEPAQREGGS
jgi:nucleotide-binding universal stress UspA family protein